MIDGLDLALDAEARARRAGADQAEAYVEDRRTTSIEVRDQRPETFTSAQARGLGLRVLVGGATAYVYTSDPRPAGLGELARRAVALAREAAPDPDRALPELKLGSQSDPLAIYDPSLAEVAPERKIDLLRAIERVAREVEPRIASTEVARYGDSSGAIALANSRGFAARYQRSFASAVLSVVARQDGEALTGYGFDFGRGFDDLSVEVVGAQAARRAGKPLGGRPVSTQKATVLLEPHVAAGYLSQVAAALSAEAVLKGRSMYAGRLGQRVGSEAVSLVDQGNLPGGPGTSPFDGEGVASQRTVLVDHGLLRGYLHSTYTARRLGVESTGNAVRGSYRSTPEVGSTNVVLETATVPRDQLIADVERGLLVLTTRNVGGINPVNGDYSVGAAGVWIEQGQEIGPVAHVTIAANMHAMLAGLLQMGDDVRWSMAGGGVACGTLRIEGMTIAGT